MKYFKQAGSVFDTYYALNEEQKIMIVIEERFADVCREFTECFVISSLSPERGTYDEIAASVVKTYQEISSREFSAVKKSASDFVKKIEEVE